MDQIRVSASHQLLGEIEIQGSKNAVLPIMAACLLTEESIELQNVPNITDVSNMQKILEHLGCDISCFGNSMTITAKTVIDNKLTDSLTGGLRASVLFLGAVLSRKNEVWTAYPGGCLIGSRPIDIHINALKQLGIEISQEEEYLLAKGRVKSGSIYLRYPSVGATENIILASVMSEKEDIIIYGAAREPEISYLCEFLNSIGAHIDGIGSSTLIIKGVKKLHGGSFRIPGDRIVAGTYAIATAAKGGDIWIKGIYAPDLAGQYYIIASLGADLTIERGAWHIKSKGKPKALEQVSAGPYPGFPTDLQSPLLAGVIRADGRSRIADTVYSGRYNIVKELKKIGADVVIKDNMAIITGIEKLHGSTMNAYELRGAAGLIIAAMQAEDECYISGNRFLERGYEDICRDLGGFGVNISKS